MLIVPAPGRVALQTTRIDLIINDPSVPKQLLPTLKALREALQAAKEGCKVGQVVTQWFAGLGGKWAISRFTANGYLWVGIEWPRAAADNYGWAIRTLQRMADEARLTDPNSNATERQLWINLGAKE